jgi:hypothetical protein
VAELACHPLKSQTGSAMTWLKIYNNMINDVYVWASVHILSFGDAEVLPEVKMGSFILLMVSSESCTID